MLGGRTAHGIAESTGLAHGIAKRRIVIGEVAVSAAPLLLQTLLGSCVAVCLYDPVARVGGMNHILLPGDCEQRASRFGANAMELLINQVMRSGGERRRLMAKAFGAGNVVPGLRAPTCGDQNAAFVRAYLSNERIPLVAERLGGTDAVQVHFRTDTGKAVVHSIHGSRLSSVLSSVLKVETGYSDSHRAEENFTGDVTLF